MSNPVEEFLSLKKMANIPNVATQSADSLFKGFKGHLGHAAAGAAASALVGAAGMGLHSAVGKIYDAATKGRDFRSMLAANQDLQEHHAKDPKRFNMMFSTLRTMNPHFSKDPLVAGAFMRQMQESPTGIGGIASEALKHRKDFPSMFAQELPGFAREGAKAGLTHAYQAPAEQRAHDLRERQFNAMAAQAENAEEWAKKQHQQRWDIANLGKETETFDPTHGITTRFETMKHVPPKP